MSDIEKNPFVEGLRQLKGTAGYTAWLHLIRMEKCRILNTFMFGNQLNGDQLMDLQRQMRTWVTVINLVDDTIQVEDKFVEQALRDAEEQLEKMSDAKQYRDYAKMHASSGDLMGGY